MQYDPDIHHRRSIRLPLFDYSAPGAYFVTLCTHRKEFLFGIVAEGQMTQNECGEIVSLYWNYLPKRFARLEVDSFIVMPNHVHGIIGITGAVDEPPGVGAIHESPLRAQRRKMLLSKIIGYFKMNTSKRINEIRGTPERPVWQRNYYEHIIRNDDELCKIRGYMATNPLRWAQDRENPMAERDGDDEPPWV